jgi:hypothetical protein
MIAGTANGRTIYVAIVADVARLLARDGTADVVPAAAADVETANGRAVTLVGPRSRLVTASSAAQTERAASNTVALEVGAGNIIRFYAKSGSNNFEDAVLIADIGPVGDGDVLQDFTIVEVERNTVAPRDYDHVFPARFPERDFWFWQCVVTTDGNLHCSVLLAAYDRDEQGRPSFAGYYRWSLRLTLKLTSPSPIVSIKERRHE